MKLSKQRKVLFKELIETVAVSGKEQEMARVLRKYYEPLCDEIITDNIGSICAHKKSKNPNAPKVLLLGHMDEVGLHVGKILDDGVLLISDARASIWNQTLMAQRVYVQTRDNKLINGVIDTIPPHLLTPELRQKPMEISKMMVDIGCKSKKEAEDMGVNVFDPICVRGDLEELGDGSRLLGKAFDNRYGCLMGIELLQLLKNTELDIDLYIGASVQEELGGSGAQSLTTKIMPDFAIVLDCSPASDMGGGKDLNGMLGQGVLLRYVDRSMIAFPTVLQYQEKMCKKVGAKCQYFLSAGGTDAGTIHRIGEGIITLTNCICARNIHTNASIIDLDDYEASKKVLLAILKDLDAKRLEEFKKANR